MINSREYWVGKSEQFIMVLQIINLICVILAGLIAGVFIAFVVFKLRKIDSQTDNISKPRHPWGMGVYMDEIPQNTARLVSVPLKIYEGCDYSDIPVPRKGEEIFGVYYSGEHKFEMTGIVKDVFYNTDMNLIIVECKCTEIHKID